MMCGFIQRMSLEKLCTERSSAVSAPWESLKVTYAIWDRSFVLKQVNWMNKSAWWSRSSQHSDGLTDINKYNQTNLCISTYSMAPEKEKNSLMSCSDAPKETLLIFTVLTCNYKEMGWVTKRIFWAEQLGWKGSMLLSFKFTSE